MALVGNASGAGYVLFINGDNTITTTVKNRIIQRSNMVDNLWFLAERFYNGCDMSEFTVVLEYLSPVSHKYRTEFLVLSDETYNNYLKYVLPVTTKLTEEPGQIQILLSFVNAELDENGRGIQRVRKISETTIHVHPISEWSDIIPDCALSALDQRIIKMDAQIKALNETSVVINSSKADNVFYDEESNEFQLMSGDTFIGDRITIKCDASEDGIPAVVFSKTTSGSDNTNDDSFEVVVF